MSLVRKQTLLTRTANIIVDGIRRNYSRGWLALITLPVGKDTVLPTLQGFAAVLGCLGTAVAKLNVHIDLSDVEFMNDTLSI
jgi:hypothetical protein